MRTALAVPRWMSFWLADCLLATLWSRKDVAAQQVVGRRGIFARFCLQRMGVMNGWRIYFSFGNGRTLPGFSRKGGEGTWTKGRNIFSFLVARRLTAVFLLVLAMVTLVLEGYTAVSPWQPAHAAAPLNTSATDLVLPIGHVQGEGDASPLLDQVVTFRGVVTGFYEDRNTAGVTYYTLFVQDLPGYEDDNPATSDGIAVFLGRRRPSVAIGDQVRVTGRVTEFYGLTELDDRGLTIEREATNLPLPNPIVIDPPAEAAALAAYLEPYEGMRVAIAGEARVVGPTFSGCGFAVVSESVSAPRILRRQVSDPIGQVLPILHTSDVTCGDFPWLNAGDRVRGLVGPLFYHFNQYKLVLQETAVLQISAAPTPPLPQPLVLQENQFSIASFNLENYFDTVDDTGSEAEPKPTATELAQKQAKLAAALARVLGCPTIVGVQEVENRALLEALAAQVQPACGFAYAVVHEESADGRGIDVAYLVDERRVQLQAARLRRGCTPLVTGVFDPIAACPRGEAPLFARPPLEMTALIDGRSFTFWVNHFKSKREGEAETAPLRLAQANFLRQLAAERLAADPDAALIVLGDFNDYELSAPLLVMAGDQGPLYPALRRVPEALRYSYVYAGVSQLIDGILVSPALVERIVDATIMHVNADFVDAWSTDTSPERLAYRSTDHDLPLVVLELPSLAAESAVSSLAAPVSTSSAPISPWGSGRFWLIAGLIAGLLFLVLAQRFIGRRRD